METINYKMVEGMTYGDEIDLGNNQTLYHYCEEDIIVVLNTDEWEEVYQVLINEDKTLTFESL